ncbi:hypothetical protein [Lentibacillus jeotgali]|uniref:hypothetical protein n=1 Tax=Lentibacillus jeotgali TaxID=558169 RepID=UPI0002625FFE|nr:hypothetical protein [Lentibacillus jeotgali]
MGNFLFVLICIVSYLIIRKYEIEKFGHSLKMKESLDLSNPNKFHIISRLKYVSLSFIGLYIGNFLHESDSIILEGFAFLLIVVFFLVFLMFAVSLVWEGVFRLFIHFFGD